MAQHVLIGPVGFQEWKTQEVVLAMEFDELILLRTSHKRAKRHLMTLKPKLKERGIGMQEIEVRPAFDFVAWYRAMNHAIENHRGADITVNLTAGHGVAISMAALVAARRSLACVCYDIVEHQIHHASPAILFGLERLVDTDRKILRVLAKGPRTVGQIHAETSDKTSTTSMALQRLRADGWVTSQREGQSIRYDLRPGVRPFVTSEI